MNPYRFNAEWWFSHSEESFEPIIIPAKAIGCRLMFIPAYFSYKDFVRLADIAEESGHKLLPCKRGGWKNDRTAPHTITHGRPAWQLHHSENGWSTWCDIRAASLPESEYELFQLYVDDRLNIFLDEIARSGGDVSKALIVADTNIIKLNQNQGLTETEVNPWKNPSTLHRCRPSERNAEIALAEVLRKSGFAR